MQAKLTSRRAHFLVMINEEYLRAIQAGPPLRNREFGQSGRRTVEASRRKTADAENINDRPTVP